MISNYIITGCWVVFLGYWFISAFSAKRTVQRNGGLAIFFRVAIMLFILVVLSEIGPRGIDVYRAYVQMHPLLAALGALFCVVGVALAVWARTYLGSNWGMPMSVKEQPELVTTGPYRFVRHPIYTGVILAMIGSALAEGLWLILAIIAMIIYFIYCARQEEKLMTQEFPDAYPAYKAHTKMLIPFLF